MASKSPETATNVATNAATNAVTISATRQNTNLSGTTNVVDPVTEELKKIMAADDAAREQADKWIRDSNEFEKSGASLPAATLTAKIEETLKPVKKSYEEFIQKYPDHAPARLAFGSFLYEMKDEAAAAEQWEKARELDPKNPAAWNNLANYYGHRSPVKKSFEYYAKAIELNPNEPVYFQNYATTVYLFRKDAMEYYGITEKEVFDKALDLYRQAVKLAPGDFLVYTDYAQSFYGTNPPRWAEGYEAWKVAKTLARDDIEREGVLTHLARCAINLGKFDEAKQHLSGVTNEMYLSLKGKLEKKMAKLQSGEAVLTNSVDKAVEK